MPNPKLVECQINKVFLDQLNTFSDRNEHRFGVNGAVTARQHLFNSGIHATDNDNLAALRVHERRKEFLDPRQRRVSVKMDNGSCEVVDNFCAVHNINRSEVIPTVLRLGYDRESI